jgi:hypothetical protein
MPRLIRSTVVVLDKMVQLNHTNAVIAVALEGNRRDCNTIEK